MTVKTNDLIEQRTAIVARMNEAHTADNEADFTAAETELRSLDGKLERARKLDAADRADPGRTLHGTPDGLLDRELRSFSVLKMLAHKAGMPADAGREIELQGELAKRAGKPAEGFYVPDRGVRAGAPRRAGDGHQRAHRARQLPPRPLRLRPDQPDRHAGDGRHRPDRPHGQRRHPAGDGLPGGGLGRGGTWRSATATPPSTA